MSNVLLPNKKSNDLIICSAIIRQRKLSNYGTIHPQYVKFPLVSSVGPPGACITPSSVMKVRTTSFLIVFLLFCCYVSDGDSMPYAKGVVLYKNDICSGRLF